MKISDLNFPFPEYLNFPFGQTKTSRNRDLNRASSLSSLLEKSFKRESAALQSAQPSSSLCKRASPLKERERVRP